MIFDQHNEFFHKEHNLEIKELAKSQKKGACGSVLQDAKLKGSKHKHEHLCNVMISERYSLVIFECYNALISEHYSLGMFVSENIENIS